MVNHCLPAGHTKGLATSYSQYRTDSYATDGPVVALPSLAIWGTLDGYRSAIEDKLGNSPISFSKDENLTHLLDSFHRDRPKCQKNISSWNLSLVLHQLTKAPFEPKGGFFEVLYCQDCLPLSFGFRQTQDIHAWLSKNIRHQSDWSKMILALAPTPDLTHERSGGPRLTSG